MSLWFCTACKHMIFFFLVFLRDNTKPWAELWPTKGTTLNLNKEKVSRSSFKSHFNPNLHAEISPSLSYFSFVN